jgi:very-short-patch-repair endonuclease
MRSSWGKVLAQKKYTPKYYSGSPMEDDFLAQVRAAGLPEPTREFQFHPVRRWRADFAWQDQKILVEIQGGLYGRFKGRHVTQVEADYEKINAAQVIGYRVFQFGHRALNHSKTKHPEGLSDAITLLKGILCPSTDQKS